MAASSTSTMTNSSTTIMDLDEDALAHCAAYLSLQDVSNVAVTCKTLRRAAYSDSIWSRFCREHWPPQVSLGTLAALGARKAYIARHIALHQLKFKDPTGFNVSGVGKPCDHVLLDKDYVIYSQGSLVWVTGLGNLPTFQLVHNGRICCMRLFPLADTSLLRGESKRDENFLVTSSCDRTIRLWWKGSSQRCFKGHNGAVSTLSDKLLGDGSSKILASGGEDGTVRLWALSSSGKRGQRALKATFYGHEKPIKLMSVAGHKSSLLATISRDSKMRVWDTNTSSSSRSSCCVGMTSVLGTPVDMKCYESIFYIASGSSIQTVDLRTMQKVSTAALCTPRLHSFDMLPSTPLICTGGDGKALLWDIRKNQDSSKPAPVAEMEGHRGPVTRVHMDPYKIVTGGLEDIYVNVWETDTGVKTNSLTCYDPEDADTKFVSTAMAVQGCRVVTSGHNGELTLIKFRDFSRSIMPILRYDDEASSTFWGPQAYSDTDSSEDSHKSDL